MLSIGIILVTEALIAEVFWETKGVVLVPLNIHAYMYGELPPETVAVKVLGPPTLIGVELVNVALQFNVCDGSKSESLSKPPGLVW